MSTLFKSTHKMVLMGITLMAIFTSYQAKAGQIQNKPATSPQDVILESLPPYTRSLHEGRGR
jgi:hypothetical protein